MDEPAESRAEGPPSFLGSEPPPLAARGLSLLLISIFVVASLLAAVVKVPETVSAPFVLVPFRGADPVRAPRAGTVAEAHAVESAMVAKGAVLFVLRSPGAADRTSELQTAEARAEGAREGLANARRRFESETLSAEQEMKRLLERAVFLDRMLVLKKEQLVLTEDQAERARRLNEQGLASLDQRSDAQIRNSQTEGELVQLQTDQRETRIAIEKLRHAEETRKAAFREEERALAEKVTEARIRIDALRGEQAGTTGGGMSVLSPCDGTLLRVGVRNAGAVVSEGDVLSEIACSGDRLQAELKIPQEGLSRVRPGEPVKLLYEAFPYQRYGIKEGVVRWASPSARAATAADDPSAFRAFVELADQTVRVNGELRPFLPGMKGTALVVVGRRSAISYAFDPLRQLRETLK